MTTWVHDDEPDTSSEVLRALLRGQNPELAELSVEPLSNTGTDNAMYRLGQALVARLPRRASAASGLGTELRWLPRLAGRLPAAVPEVVHAGEPGEEYPYQWAVLTWLDGIDAWEARNQRDWFGPDLGRDLAELVLQLRKLPIEDAPRREPGARGGSLAALDSQVRWWLDRAHGLIDVRAVTRIWDECLDGAVDSVEPALVHGDLIPGNLLVDHGRLLAVIDWGGMGAGDPAQDLDPAWSVLDTAGAAAFREALDVDEPMWLRARGFVLEHAIGGVIYYTPRRHPLADVMRRSLNRLLSGL